MKTVVDGVTFDSKREASVWQSLKILERAGEIRELKRQVPFDLSVNGERICRYVADFQWVEDAPTTMKHIREFIVTADAKGVRTPVYKLKAKLMKAIHGIEIREL